MADIFDTLSAQKDQQNQPANPPATEPSAKPVAFNQPVAGDDHGQDIFDKIHTGQDVSLPKASGDASIPGHIDPSDMGVIQSLKRNTTGLLKLPAHVAKAFEQPAQDSMERDIERALHGGKDLQPGEVRDGRAVLGNQVMLAFKRLIVDPMREQNKQALAYEHMYDHMTPEERAKAEKELDAYHAQHLSNMHHIASIIPILGPAAGDMTDRIANGDTSGGLTDLLFNIVTAGAMKKLAGKVKALGPGEKVIANEKVPVLASQEGNAAAGSLETAAKASGSAGKISRFVDKQRTALEQASGNVAQSAAEESIQKLNQNAGATALSRARSFKEAADTLRTAAKPKLKLVDDLTDGKLSKIWDERDSLIEKSKAPGQKFSDWQATQKRLGELSTEEQDLFKLRNPSTGRFQKVITAQERSAAVRAGRVWQQANDMEQLHAAMEGAGAEMGKKISALDPAVLDRSVGGNAAHVSAIKDIARLMASGEKAAQVNNVLRLVKFVTQKGSLGTSNVASQGISTILTNRTAANALAGGIKAGAAAPVIAASINKVLEREQKAE